MAIKTYVIEKDHGWKEFEERFSPKGGKSLEAHIGFLRSSGMHRQENEEAAPITVAQVAAIHEFGTADGKIPERSFMRSAMNENKDKIIGESKRQINHVLEGSQTQKQALAEVAELIAQQIKNKILSGPFAPLSDSTVKKKGSSKPLIDTAQMLNSVEWELRDPKAKGGE